MSAADMGSDGIIGSTITHYRIVDRIGQGGMGVVYKAEDTMLDRTVALKFLPPGMATDESVEKRFILEAKAASSLDHANIAVIHEISRTEDGRLFIAMGYYEGETLEDKIDAGALEIEKAVDYAMQMAKGLVAAHEKGIVHRDIKPGNAIVTPGGDLKILDFGLAKMQDVTMTMDDVSLGTMAYMSPEQARNAPVDHRTDLWAAGVVLYEMLAGQRPFPGAYQAALLYAAANEPHPPVTNHRPEVPEWLSHIVDRLLEKDPESRYQSAEELVRALESGAGVATVSSATQVGPPVTTVQDPALSGQAFDPARFSQIAATGQHPASQMFPAGTLSGEYPSGFPVPPPPGRNRAILWGGGTAVAVLLLAVAAWGLGWLQAGSRVSEITEEQRAEARSLYGTALGLRADRQFSLSRMNLEQALELDSTYSEAWATLSAVDMALQDYDSAIDHAGRAVRLDPESTVGYFNLALGLEGKGRYAEAITIYEKAIDIDPTFVAGYSAWAYRLIEMEREEEALSVLARGLSSAPNSPLTYLLYKNAGKAYLALGKNEEAVGALEESVSLKQGNPEALNLLARAYEAVGLTADARKYWRLYADVETDPAKRRAAEERLKQ
jgi:serine/threonine protein kinase/Tfp pilus assembly protein PilF